jgi:hypothetical protein
MMLDPYAHVRIHRQEHERTMAKLALERAARSAALERSTDTADRRIRRRNPLLRLAAMATALSNVGRALHLTRSTGG